MFEALLKPHRSLGRAGFVALMAAFAVISFAAGMAFVAIGAWPVFGFFGLDVLLLYVAFKINFRQARGHEQIRLDATRLTVTRVSADGAVRVQDFEPYWLTVRMQDMDRPYRPQRLVIASHGRETPIGDFLGETQRAALHDDLTAALARWKSAASSRASS